MTYPDPIAYTYEADTHCPDCALERFGRDADGWIAAGVEDSEGNEPGVVAPWDEEPDGLVCGTCGDVILEKFGEDEDEEGTG